MENKITRSDIINWIYTGSIFLVLLFILNRTTISCEVNRPNVDTVYIHDTIKISTIKASYYNPTKKQCDDNPKITADGTRINRNTKNLIAVSRDMLKNYSFGDSLRVISPRKVRGTYFIHDTMNKRFKKRIDFLTYDKINIDSVTIIL
jgi:3D (Asp-Asp-Asp) domain-containing protein